MDDLPLFAFHDPEPLSSGALQGMTRAAGKHEQQIRALIPLAQELGRKVESLGCTVSDLRLYAVQRGLLTEKEKGRELSYLGVVMKRAGLVATDRVRRSGIRRSHGNLHRLFVLPAYASRGKVA